MQENTCTNRSVGELGLGIFCTQGQIDMLSGKLEWKLSICLLLDVLYLPQIPSWPLLAQAIFLFWFKAFRFYQLTLY